MNYLMDITSKWIDKGVNHYLNFNKNVHKLKRKYEELNSQKEDVESRAKVEVKRGKRLKKEVGLWLADVRKINDKKPSIENEVREGNYFRRARLGGVVVEMIEEVENLYQKGSCFDNLAIDAPPRCGEIFPPTNLVGETTAIRNMEEIWESLMHDETRLIGVFGMGGAGKTTVMQQINNRLLEQTDKFDSVIWITVSKASDVFKIQDCISSKLKVDLSSYQDETTRATKLFDELSKNKGYVLIFDDVWEAFELKNVGIPEPTCVNGCKIVLTTRSLAVCRNMDCTAIKMELLSKDEAWNLFLDKVGHDLLRIPGLEDIMKLVAEECACLPLAITTIAGSMKGVVDEHEWRNALEELRGTRGLSDMVKVLKHLKYSYSRLKDKMLQQCLLYCALYPEDFEIERKDLIMRLIDEGIVEGTSRKAKFDKGHSMLNKLENACLLERVTKDYNSLFVKMHDLIRDMSFWVMGRGCMVKAGVQLKEFPDKEKWTGDLKRVSLMNNHISEIRFETSPECCKLSTLLLFGNGGLRMIPNSFFLLMCQLRILDLSHTGIESLPHSVSDLSNLTALLLRWCSNLKSVPSLERCCNLRRLDLGGSGIQEVPKGIEWLFNLNYLNLTAESLKAIPPGILPKLYRLQCLIVWWGSKDLNIKASEVTGLRKLETLAIRFDDQCNYNEFIGSWQDGMPRNYLLQVGRQGRFLDFDEEGSYFRKYVGMTGCGIRGGTDAFMLPGDVGELEIKECHDVKSLCHVPSMHHKTRSLKYCKIINCAEMKCVISCSNCILHQSLEVLQLEDLQSLRVIFGGEGESPSPPPPGISCVKASLMGAFSSFRATPMATFSRLKELRIVMCRNIRRLFTPELLPNLENLEEVHVENCEEMEEIIAAKERGEEGESSSSSHWIVDIDDSIITATLPKLRRLTLEGLPRLKSIVSSKAVMVCDFLQILTVLRCPKLKRLPLHLPIINGGLSPPTALLQIEMNDKEWWESLEWDPPNAKDVLEPFLLQLDERGLPIR